VIHRIGRPAMGKVAEEAGPPPQYPAAMNSDDMGDRELEALRRESVARAFSDASFLRTAGIKLVDCGAGWCESAVELEPGRHGQGQGFAHGGLLATMLDHTAGAAAWTLCPGDAHAVTADLTISFLRPARGLRLRCRAEVVKPGRNLTFVDACVYASGRDGQWLAAKACVTIAIVNQPPARAGTT
jgi:uncharacterized protein (TIGR00369 family)